MNQNYRFDFLCIKGVSTGMLLYENNGEMAKIDIRKSAETWWNLHNRNTIMNILLKRRAKNKFAGINVLPIQKHISDCMRTEMRYSLKKNFQMNGIQMMRMDSEHGGSRLTETSISLDNGRLMKDKYVFASIRLYCGF